MIKKCSQDQKANHITSVAVKANTSDGQTEQQGKESENEQENTTTVPLNNGSNRQQTRQQRIM